MITWKSSLRWISFPSCPIWSQARTFAFSSGSLDRLDRLLAQEGHEEQLIGRCPGTPCSEDLAKPAPAIVQPAVALEALRKLCHDQGRIIVKTARMEQPPGQFGEACLARWIGNRSPWSSYAHCARRGSGGDSSFPTAFSGLRGCGYVDELPDDRVILYPDTIRFPARQVSQIRRCLPQSLAPGLP